MPWHNLAISDKHLDTIVRWGYFVGFPLVLGVVLAFLYFSNTTNTQLRTQNSQLRDYAAKIQMLSLQNKDLNTKTQGVVAQNREYIRCVANTFATFTQNQKPVAFTDLDKCEVTDLSSPASSNASSQVHAGSSLKSSSKTPTSSSASASGQATPPKSSSGSSSSSNPSTQPQPSQPNLLQRIGNRLFN